jgi:uncharacterized protein (DUF2252 family)
MNTPYHPLAERSSPDERRAAGKAVRSVVSRRSHAGPDQWPDFDPVEELLASDDGRVEELVPIRHGRMAASPFAFYRGAAGIMAKDLAGSPHSGLMVQLCGDAHLANFGLFATAERRLVFDLNDFDETLPGPFEWDLKRLVASFVLAARATGRAEEIGIEAARAAAAQYRTRMAELALLPALDVWYLSSDIDAVTSALSGKRRRAVDAAAEKARRKTHSTALRKLTQEVDGHVRFRHEPPLLLRREGDDELWERVAQAVIGYRDTLHEERRHLLDRYRLVDVALKVVGVGSVGTRCWVALFSGPLGTENGDFVVLQVKEARPSVLAPHLGDPAQDHDGHRVVAGQRAMQSAGDVFLGWLTGPGGMTYYVRQLFDMKGGFDVTVLDDDLFIAYARSCAAVLARAHARTGDPLAISGYLGRGTVMDEALTSFAVRYADRAETQHAAVRAAIADGRVPAASDH